MFTKTTTRVNFILNGLFATVCVLTAAEQSSWTQQLEEAKRLKLDGDYASARRVLLTVLRSGEQGKLSRPAVAVTLNNLGVVLDLMGRYAEAEQAYLQSIRRFEEIRSSPADLSRPLNNLAALYVAAGRYSQAETLFRRVLAIRREVDGPAHPNVATVLGNIGQVLLERSEYPLAAQYLSEALAIWRGQADPPPELGITCSALARLDYELGEYETASRFAEEAVTILKVAPGAQPHSRIAALVIAARIGIKLGAYASAGRRLAEALQIASASLGDKHPRTAEVFRGQAELARSLNRKPEAKDLEKRANTILADHYRDNHLYHSDNTIDYRMLKGPEKGDNQPIRQTDGNGRRPKK
jgi:tetratricopeptide (TPR) repeat protein